MISSTDIKFSKSSLRILSFEFESFSSLLDSANTAFMSTFPLSNDLAVIRTPQPPAPQRERRAGISVGAANLRDIQNGTSKFSAAAASGSGFLPPPRNSMRSATISTAFRFSPALVSKLRTWIRPWMPTISPLPSRAQSSAVLSHATTSTHVGVSFPSLIATEKLTTDFPVSVFFSSGACPTLPVPVQRFIRSLL